MIDDAFFLQISLRVIVCGDKTDSIERGSKKQHKNLINHRKSENAITRMKI